jgi:hypothetical protein
MTKHMMTAEVGPPFPLVSIKDFNRFPLKEADLRHLWEITGPSAALNLRSNPLWRVIAMAYFEGLMHGAVLEKERHPLQNLDSMETAMPTKQIKSWNVMYNGTTLGKVFGISYDDAAQAANKLYAKWDFLTPN